MMSDERALEILEEVLLLDDTMYAYDEKYLEALEIAMDALRERIAK